MAEQGCTGPDCYYLGEKNKSPAKKGDCTETRGYIANAKIYKIQQLGKTDWEDNYDEDSDSNIMVYNNVKWVGYMSSKTKKSRADKYKKLNFAGISDWAVDLLSKNNKDEVIYVDDNVYKGHEINCKPPCMMVLPPSKLPKKTTITLKPWTTEVDIGGTTTTTITVTPDALTVETMSFYNIPITGMNINNATMIQPYPSLSVNSIEVPITYKVGDEKKTTTKTLLLPPWPLITNRPDHWDGNSTSIPTDGGTLLPTLFPEISFPPPPQKGGPRPTWYGTSLPTRTNWQTVPAKITPITSKPPEPELTDPEDDEQSVNVPCDLWFFDACIDELNIKGWKWILPPGVIRPGPPPPGAINPAPGWTITPKPPVWPVLTIGPDGKPDPVPDKPDPCEPEKAELCSYGTSYGVNGAGETTTTTKTSTCHTITGCHVTDWDESASTTGTTCKPTDQQRDVPVTNMAVPTPTSLVDADTNTKEEEEEEEKKIFARVEDPGPFADQNDPATWAYDAELIKQSCVASGFVVYCKDPEDCDTVTDRLERLPNYPGSNIKITKAATKKMDFIAFFWVDNLPYVLIDPIKRMKQVDEVYDPVDYQEGLPAPDPMDTTKRKHKRAWSSDPRTSKDWANSRVSIPPGIDEWWKNRDFTTDDLNVDDTQKEWKYHYYHEDSPSEQVVYVVDECFELEKWPDEFSHLKTIDLDDVPEYGPEWGDLGCEHGNMVAGRIAGKTLGIMPNAVIAGVGVRGPLPGPFERNLHALLIVLDDLIENPDRGKRGVLNMSWRVQLPWVKEGPFHNMMSRILKMLKEKGLLMVTAVGNTEDDQDVANVNWDFPQRYALDEDLSDAMIIVGALTQKGGRWEDNKEYFGENSDDILIYAPGVNMMEPDPDEGLGSGTSYSTAVVSGLVAYIRGLPLNDAMKSWLSRGDTPYAPIKKLIQKLARALGPPDEKVPSIWSGQVLKKNCLVDGFQIEYKVGDKSIYPCKDLADWFDLDECIDYSGGDGSRRLRRDGGECPIGNPNGLPSDIPLPSSITWREGDPFPTCTDNCGKLCEGYYCNPKPTGQPPDFAGPTRTTTETPKPTPTDDPDEPDDPGDGDDGPACMNFIIDAVEVDRDTEQAQLIWKIDGTIVCHSVVEAEYETTETKRFTFDCGEYGMELDLSFIWEELSGNSYDWDKLSGWYQLPGLSKVDIEFKDPDEGEDHDTWRYTVDIEC